MTDFRDRLQQSLGGAYTIERELGGGGMSHVFVAADRTLGRRIVVKVLPVALSDGVSATRFRREIAVAAQLQHPHIVPVLAAGEVDGLPYYTMPFVAGESLRARLAAGALPVQEVVSILRDVARGLDFAHKQGIVHRDIKPDNILLAGESAMITDFGVARALHDAAPAGPLTSAGVALGTPAYMAPEQAAADPATDARADIYAFGATAYEMLAGHTPFPGRSPQSTIAAHATEAPPDLAMLRPAIPAPLAHLVMRCLEKHPADRPQRPSELLQALDAIGSGVVVARPRLVFVRALIAAGVIVAIAGAMLLARAHRTPGAVVHALAVLPFDNTSGDTAIAFLEDGIADQVRDALHGVPALTVKARSSSRLLKGTPAREVGARLGVDAVLQGTMRLVNGRLHVTTDLVRSSDESSLWSSSFDAPTSDLGALQDRIVQAVAAQLHSAVAGTGTRPLTRTATRGTTDGAAYESFLRGRHDFDRMDFIGASAHFRDAVAHDPRFAAAHGYLAMAYANTMVNAVVPVDSFNALAEASARRALALDSASAEAYEAQSFILVGKLRMADAIAPIEKAVAIDSGNVDALANYGVGLLFVGRPAEALTQARRARDHDPLSPAANGILAYVLEMNGQLKAAIDAHHAAIELDKANPFNRQGLGFVFAFAGMPDSALAEFRAALRLDSVAYFGRSGLVFAHAAAGHWAEAARERAKMDHDPPGTSPHFVRAVAALAFGEREKAMAELERSVAGLEAMAGLVAIACDPIFDSLKSDARFDALMRRIGAHACAPALRWPIAPR